MKCCRMVDSIPRYLYNTVRPSVDPRLVDTTFGAETFSWQDPVHSWKAGPGVVMTVENLFYYMNQLATKCTFLVSENLMFTL